MNHLLKRSWTVSASLTLAGLLMLGALGVSLAGLIVDDRLITGAPAWLKPAKFATSTAIYCFTVAWLLTYIDKWPRLMRWIARVIAFVIVFEVVVIDIQAARGIT